MTVQSRPDFKAWIDLTLNELSAIGRGVANDALRDVKGFRSTVEKFKDQSRSDVQMLRALINRKFPRSTTSISRQTAFQALAEFFSLRFYLEMFSAIKTGPAYQHWLEKWTEDDAKMRLLSDEALVDASTTSWAAAEEFWIFFVALCRRLQQDENPLTAADAFHLGLIDEVIGLASPNLRVFVENARDPL